MQEIQIIFIFCIEQFVGRQLLSSADISSYSAYCRNIILMIENYYRLKRTHLS